MTRAQLKTILELSGFVISDVRVDFHNNRKRLLVVTPETHRDEEIRAVIGEKAKDIDIVYVLD